MHKVPWNIIETVLNTPLADSAFSKSSRSQIFLKTGVLKKFANFTGKHLCWSLFLIKFQVFRPATLIKRDCNTGVFLWKLWNLRKFKSSSLTEHLRPVDKRRRFSGYKTSYRRLTDVKMTSCVYRTVPVSVFDNIEKTAI